MALIVLLIAALSAFAEEPHRCAACHADAVTDFKTHAHAKNGLDCGVCHGLSEKHRNSVGNVPPDQVAAPNEVSKMCGNCHITEKQHYESSAHFRAYSSAKKVRTANCNTCHGHHAPRPLAALAAGCQRCHSSQPQACKGAPTSAIARVSCMGCHATHTLKTSSH